ncbi:ETX/MTX2 family pore-forming toxin [Bacillus thuringiensis]|nr:ETX/MTX2 family pore-forming toxin [Bacillus thuringiensis]
MKNKKSVWDSNKWKSMLVGMMVATGVAPNMVHAEGRNGSTSVSLPSRDVNPEYEEVKGVEQALTEKTALYSTLQSFTNENVKKVNGVQFQYTMLPTYAVELDTKQVDKPSSSVYIGVSYLSHTGDTNEQTLYSSMFSKAVTETVTATTTHGAKVGAKATAKFKIPVVGETSVELNAEYNFAYADTKTDTEMITYTIPAQPVKVKPNQTAKVTATLKMMESTGKVKLRTMYGGEIESYYTDKNGKSQQYRVGMGNWVKQLLMQPENQALQGVLDYSQTNPHIMYQDGAGTYQAVYGTTVEIQVDIFENPITKSKEKTGQGVLVDSYSYEIQPAQIQK